MDIEAIVKQAVAKLTGNNELIGAFLKDPAKTLKDKLGIEVTAEQIDAVVKGIKDTLKLDDAAVKQATGLLAKIKALFCKK